MRVLRLLVLVPFALACGEAPPPEPEAPALVRLADAFDSEQVVSRVQIVEPERSEWAAADGGEWSWKAVAGLAQARLEDGALRATTTSERPLLEILAPGPLGDGDRVHAIEVRLRVSAGSELKMAALDAEDPPTPAFAQGDEPPLALSSPLTPGDDATTYRIDLSRTLALGPFGRTNPHRVLLRPTDAAGAEIALESVRIVFRREHLASVPSGLGWHGLGEVWRETLVSRPGETLRIPLSVPTSRPILDIAVGTPVEAPVTFTAEVARTNPSAEGGPLRLLRRTVTTADRWEEELIDLGELAGQQVELLLRIDSDDPSAVGLWGSGQVAARGVGPAAPDSDRPQGVLVVVADTLRRDHLELWGYERETAPTLTRLAGEGVLFRDPIVQAVWTKVSVPSILTGLYPDVHGIQDIPDRLPASATTLAEAFREAGYPTMATSSWAFTGQLTNLHQGVDVLWEGGSVDLPDGASGTKTARFFFDRALEFIERHRDRPFLIVLHLGDPHSPYEPLAPWADEWAAPGSKEKHDALRDEILPKIESPFFRVMELPQGSDIEREGMDLEWWRDHEIDWYDGSIRGLDAELRRVVDRLEHLGLTDHVALTFTSDHGEEFFEHGNNWHGTNLYGHQTDVPLVFWAPGHLPRGVVVEPTVQSIDILPTLCDLAGIEVPERAQGRSLLPLVEAVAAGEAPGSRGFRQAPAFVRHVAEPEPGVPPAMVGTSRAIVTGQWRLVHYAEGHEGKPEFELFDREADPLGLRDVADRHPEVVEDLAARLAAWQKDLEGKRLEAGEAGEMSAAEMEKLRSLGYL